MTARKLVGKTARNHHFRFESPQNWNNLCGTYLKTMRSPDNMNLSSCAVTARSVACATNLDTCRFSGYECIICGGQEHLAAMCVRAAPSEHNWRNIVWTGDVCACGGAEESAPGGLACHAGLRVERRLMQLSGIWPEFIWVHLLSRHLTHLVRTTLLPCDELHSRAMVVLQASVGRTTFEHLLRQPVSSLVLQPSRIPLHMRKLHSTREAYLAQQFSGFQTMSTARLSVRKPCTRFKAHLLSEWTQTSACPPQ